MILYGDPRHNAVATYNVGTATQDGIFIRPTNQTLTPFAEKIQSYCNSKSRNFLAKIFKCREIRL
jgi:acetylxylan esterase